MKYYIDVGDLSPEEATKIVQEWIQRRKRPDPDESQEYSPLSQLEDYIFGGPEDSKFWEAKDADRKKE